MSNHVASDAGSGSEQVEAIGQRIKRLRERQLLTQQELHGRSNVPLPTIKDIERGASANPRVSTLRALAAALAVSPEYLRFGDENPAQHDS